MSSPASAPTERIIFALICCIGLIAVATGAVLEIRRARRGDSIIPPHQIRLRLFSALIWAIALGSLSYAVLLLWSERGDLVQARHFLSLVSGAMLLIVIGLFLLAYDIWLVRHARRLQQAHLERTKSQLARAEIERVRQERSSGVEPLPNSPPDGAGS
ncbi:MAG TPA: hypothetical protein VNA16_01655 [Abditibacteriaceae bacterium]|nr:hypothetical protein [Abditibacteriaceae bacterium]